MLTGKNSQVTMSVLKAVKCQTMNYNILIITGSQHKAVWTLGVWKLCIAAQAGEAKNKKELTPIKCLNVKKKGKKRVYFFFFQYLTTTILSLLSSVAQAKPASMLFLH